MSNTNSSKPHYCLSSVGRRASLLPFCVLGSSTKLESFLSPSWSKVTACANCSRRKWSAPGTLVCVVVVSERQSVTLWVANRAGGQGVKLRLSCLLFSFTLETSYLFTTFTEHPDCCRELCQGYVGWGAGPRVCIQGSFWMPKSALKIFRPHSESFKSCCNKDLVLGATLNLLALVPIEDHD